jgi:rod shape-determining protein MreD
VSRPAPLPLWAQTALLGGFGVLAACAALTPLAPGGSLVAPDLLYCLVMAWVLRSPASAPIWIIVALGLLGDVMMSRPIGLGALGLMLASEVMRVFTSRLRGAAFVLEWLAVMTGFVAMLAGVELVMRLALAPGPGLGPSMRYVVSTAIAYPVVAAGLAFGLGLHPQRPVRATLPAGRAS